MHNQSYNKSSRLCWARSHHCMDTGSVVLTCFFSLRRYIRLCIKLLLFIGDGSVLGDLSCCHCLPYTTLLSVAVLLILEEDFFLFWTRRKYIDIFMSFYVDVYGNTPTPTLCFLCPTKQRFLPSHAHTDRGERNMWRLHFRASLVSFLVFAAEQKKKSR